MPYNREDNSKLELIDLSDDATVVATTGTDLQTLTPPVGFIYRVRAMYYNSVDPAGSSSGDQRLTFTWAGLTGLVAYVYGTFGNDIKITNGFYLNGTTEVPGAAADQKAVITGLIVSNSLPLELEYLNKTDVNKTGTRSLEILVEKIREAI